MKPLEVVPTGNRVTLGWDEIQRDAAELAAFVAAKGSWRGIVAVARGGLAPAAFVSRALGIHLIETISIASYDGEVLGNPTLLKEPAAAGDGQDWLIIDDLVDTGTTMRIARAILPRAHVAVLYAKPRGLPLADSFVRAFPQECWLDFPWEAPLNANAPPLVAPPGKR
jgi:xanthine phosphoribosyltransferase